MRIGDRPTVSAGRVGVHPSVRGAVGASALVDQEIGFDRVRRQSDRGVVRDNGFGVATGAGEQVGARGVVGLVVGESLVVDLVEGGEAGIGTVELGDRDGAVEIDDRAGSQLGELVVERDDLCPVGRRRGGGVGVDGGDGGVDLIRAGLVASKTCPHQLMPFGDEVAVPQVAVLVGESDHRAVRVGAGGSAGVGEQHEGEQAGRFGFVGHQLDEDAAESDGLGGEVDSCQLVAGGGGVAFGEHEVDRGQDGVEPVRELGVAWDPVGGVVVAELAFGADDPLGDRRFGDDEGVGDLGGIQAAEESQGERDLGVGRQRRVAAQEHQPQLVVGDDVGEGVEFVEFGVRVGVHGVVEVVGCLVTLLAAGLASDPVDRPVAGGRGDPASRVRGDAVDGPAFGGDRERFGDGVLGQVDVAEDPDQRCGHRSGFAPEHGDQVVSHPHRAQFDRAFARGSGLAGPSAAASRSGCRCSRSRPSAPWSRRGASVIDRVRA